MKKGVEPLPSVEEALLVANSANGSWRSQSSLAAKGLGASAHDVGARDLEQFSNVKRVLGQRRR